MTGRRLPETLLALSPGDLAPESLEAFAHTASRATGAGLRALLVREPALSDHSTLELSRLLRRVLPASTWIGLHDRVHLAAAAGADGVHVGFRSLAPETVRALLAESIAVGFSAHAGDDAAARRGADYLFFGPVLDTPSKRGWIEPIGFGGLSAACAASATPIWALGGLGPEHAARAFECGARGIAVLRGIFGAQDPVESAARYLAAVRAAGR